VEKNTSFDAQKESNPADEELLLRAQSGDDSAFEQLITRHKRSIYSVIYHMTSNQHDAFDLLQETFLRAYKALPKFRRDAKFSTWIYRIAINLTINFLHQSRRKSPKLSLDELDMDAAELLQLQELAVGAHTYDLEQRQLRLKELQVILNQALQSLSEKHRVVVVLHDIQGKTHAEIAKILRVPEGTVKTRLFHAHRLLRKKLSRYIGSGNF